jgi:maleylpyruvate isomerase
MSDEQHSGRDAPQADQIQFHFDPHATLAALTGHRRRFGSTVASLTVEELAAPSRCEGWTVADILRHGVWVDATFRRLWAGDESPSASFDPRTTPDESVRASRAVPDEEVRRRYLSSTETMIAALESAGPERFGDPSLSPAGRVPWWLSALHLGWDSTVHERDALTPLGRTVEAVPGELMPNLGYSLVLASLFDGLDPLNVQVGSVRLRRAGGLVTAWATTGDEEEGDNGDSSADAAEVLTGEPAAIIDALCGRGSLTGALGGDSAVIDRLGGLARYFASSA